MTGTNTPTTAAEHVAELAQAAYDASGPRLHTHNLCQIGAAFAIGVAYGLGLNAELVFTRHHPDAHDGPHFETRLADGSLVDLLQSRKFRVRQNGPR